MNDMFENLKNLKSQIKEDEAKKEKEKKQDKQKKLEYEFVSFMKDTGVKKIS